MTSKTIYIKTKPYYFDENINFLELYREAMRNYLEQHQPHDERFYSPAVTLKNTTMVNGRFGDDVYFIHEFECSPNKQFDPKDGWHD